MEKHSALIYNAIIEHFPFLQQTTKQIKRHLELDIPTIQETNIGGIVIQTSKDKSIWIRNYHPFSAYPVDTVEELIEVMKGIFDDKILWAIGYSEEEWMGTTLINSLKNFEKEKGVTYKILSWSGKLDKDIIAK